MEDMTIVYSSVERKRRTMAWCRPAWEGMGLHLISHRAEVWQYKTQNPPSGSQGGTALSHCVYVLRPASAVARRSEKKIGTRSIVKVNVLLVKSLILGTGLKGSGTKSGNGLRVLRIFWF